MKNILLFIDTVLNDSLSYSQNFWQQTNCLYEVPIVSLVINSTGKIFAACDGKGIYISTDNRIYWTQINNGLTTNYIRSLAINSAGYIFAGTNDKEY